MEKIVSATPTLCYTLRLMEYSNKFTVKSFIAFTNSPVLPDAWSPQGGYPVVIYPEYYITSYPYNMEVAYHLSGQNIYIGSWMPESKYVKILVE